MTRHHERDVTDVIYAQGKSYPINCVSSIPKARIMESGYAKKFKKNEKR